MNRKYTSKYFDYTLDFKNINFRKNPELYQIGRGEQGVLMVEPYKSEILPHWRFKTVPIAEKSAKKIYQIFLGYKQQNDFVGMDMARKFLQMGYTRARRYANHASGKKYESNPQREETLVEERVARKNILEQEKDWGTNEKALAARVFYGFYKKVQEDEYYKECKIRHKEKHDALKSDS